MKSEVRKQQKHLTKCYEIHFCSQTLLSTFQTWPQLFKGGGMGGFSLKFSFGKHFQWVRRKPWLPFNNLWISIQTTRPCKMMITDGNEWQWHGRQPFLTTPLTSSRNKRQLNLKPAIRSSFFRGSMKVWQRESHTFIWCSSEKMNAWLQVTDF